MGIRKIVKKMKHSLIQEIYEITNNLSYDIANILTSLNNKLAENKTKRNELERDEDVQKIRECFESCCETNMNIIKNMVYIDFSADNANIPTGITWSYLETIKWLVPKLMFTDNGNLLDNTTLKIATIVIITINVNTVL